HRVGYSNRTPDRHHCSCPAYAAMGGVLSNHSGGGHGTFETASRDASSGARGNRSGGSGRNLHWRYHLRYANGRSRTTAVNRRRLGTPWCRSPAGGRGTSRSQDRERTEDDDLRFSRRVIQRYGRPSYYFRGSLCRFTGSKSDGGATCPEEV